MPKLRAIYISVDVGGTRTSVYAQPYADAHTGLFTIKPGFKAGYARASENNETYKEAFDPHTHYKTLDLAIEAVRTKLFALASMQTKVERVIVYDLDLGSENRYAPCNDVFKGPGHYGAFLSAAIFTKSIRFNDDLYVSLYDKCFHPFDARAHAEAKDELDSKFLRNMLPEGFEALDCPGFDLNGEYKQRLTPHVFGHDEHDDYVEIPFSSEAYTAINRFAKALKTLQDALRDFRNPERLLQLALPNIPALPMPVEALEADHA